MKYILFIATLALCASCNWAKEKTKDTIHKSGEIVAKAGSEFADGAAKGVEKTFSNEVVISPELKGLGLTTGKVIVSSADSGTENVLTVYCIFGKDLDRKITAKLFTTDDKEYGRVAIAVKGTQNEARYVDFKFDHRTNIDYKGKLTLE